MTGTIRDQWAEREGYAGLDSFTPEGTSSTYGVRRSSALAGRTFSLHLANGRVLRYDFETSTNLRAATLGLSGEGQPVHAEYTAVECAPGIFYLYHDDPSAPRLSVGVTLDLNRAQCVVVGAEIPAEGESGFAIRRNHVGGHIGAPPTPADITGPPFPPDLPGKRFVADYGDRYAWEVIYLNDRLVAWHGIRGNPGIGDVEAYTASHLAPGVYAVSWSEKAESLLVSFVYNFNEGTITGHMLGYAPKTRRVLVLPMSGRIRPSAEYGLGGRPAPDEARSVTQRNVDVVLRQHHEIWNQARFDLVDELYAEDFESRFVGGAVRTGRDAMRDFITAHRTSFPDWTERVVDIVADGDQVVSRYVSTGTHHGVFEGIAPTGRRVTVNEVSVYRVLRGRIVSQWGFPDVPSLLAQLSDPIG